MLLELCVAEEVQPTKSTVTMVVAMDLAVETVSAAHAGQLQLYWWISILGLVP